MGEVWRRAAGYVRCADSNNRLLLVRCSLPGASDDGHWTLPGGAMEWGETPEQSAQRELVEETGLSATLGPVCGVFSRWYSAEESWRGAAGHVVGVIFDARNPRGNLRSEAKGATTDAAAWFTRAEVLELPAVELLEFALALD